MTDESTNLSGNLTLVLSNLSKILFYCTLKKQYQVRFVSSIFLLPYFHKRFKTIEHGIMIH